MSRRLRRCALGFTALTAACTTSGSIRHNPPVEPDTTLSSMTRDSVRAVQRRDSVVIDTEETLIRDPDLRTWNHLWSLRNWIRRYVAERGHLPERLEDFLPPGTGVDLEHDGWGNPIRYTRSGDTYELRALGRDGQPGTSDDMIATAERLPPRPPDNY